ncbi:hypothetical protein CHS0354_017026 [Potamilus streckersoni]|uniref:EGF-like domain-containing protein n=1 Tax=Potamilus streckersoni TaxID=2493646 RepID=A0AAE0SZI0_9BIVA|nr:hypothetical protein CHS0354_017026 [Potamilus streckersoni]
MLEFMQKTLLMATCWISFGQTNENDRGLILTSYSEHIHTLPTALDGTPILDYTQSYPLPIEARYLSIDGDYTLRHTYVYDYYSKAIYWNSNFSVGFSGNNEWMILHRGLSRDYIKLAIDWISHSIYWTDPLYKWIMVQTLLGNDTSLYRVLIHENLEGPHALALDPMEALLFWSDIGTFTKLEVSSLSGWNRKSLISSNLVHPYSLSADYVARRLYFIDAGRETVETINYEGRDRKILLRKEYSYFFDIAVYKEYLYVTEVYNNRIYFLNKTNGMELHESLFDDMETFCGVYVFHPDAQPISATAHCVNYGCEQICVTEKDGVACLCKDGYALNQDMKTCSLTTELFHRGLMFSNESSICILDIRVVTDIVFDPKCILKTNGTKYMILDTDQRQLIIAKDTSIYMAMVDYPYLQRLTETSGTISGLAWDGYDRNVYWTEEDTGTIWRLSGAFEIAKVILGGLDNPRDIIVLPHERLLYWISSRNGSAIESSKMDGSNHQIILNYEDVLEPKSLSYDPYNKRIYFLDYVQRDLRNVMSCKLDGSNLYPFIVENKSLEHLEIYRGHLLVTAKDVDGTLIMSYAIDHTTRTTSGVFNNTGNISSIKIFDETFRQNETGPCFNLNGECDQICISNGKSKLCECTFGFKLAADEKTCTSDHIKDNFMLVVDSTHNYIYQISLTDGSVQGINAKVANTLTGVAYSPIHEVVIWGTDDSELSIMYLNGTEKSLLPVSALNESYIFPNRFAVDYSTGNIFYTAGNHMQFSRRSHSYIRVISPNRKHRVLVTGLNYPNGLVVYPSKGLMFYADSGYNAHIGQANMDGSRPAVLLSIKDDWPTELTIDYKNDYLYWINLWDDSIKYCKLDGTNHNTLAMFPDTGMKGLALYQDYLFISTVRHLHITKLKISNPNETIEFAAHGPLGTIEVISMYSSTVQNKNTLCSVGNGGCSTFCFPIPGGKICGCEDGIELMDGSDTICANVLQCPRVLNQLIVSADCDRIKGSYCNFTCSQGFKARPGIDKVVCSGEVYIPADPCEEQPSVSSAHHSDVHPGIICAVVIGICVVIIILAVILRKKCRNSSFALKRMKEESISGPGMVVIMNCDQKADR